MTTTITPAVRRGPRGALDSWRLPGEMRHRPISLRFRSFEGCVEGAGGVTLGAGRRIGGVSTREARESGLLEALVGGSGPTGPRVPGVRRSGTGLSRIPFQARAGEVR